MKFLRQIWEDVAKGENLDLYATVTVAIILVLLNLAGFTSQSHLASLTLAVLALLAISLLGSRHKLDIIIKQFDDRVSQITSSTGFEHTQTSDELWKRATLMLKPIKSGYVVYDTSTFPNAEEYESVVKTGIKRGARFSRLICFSNDRNELMRESFLSVLLPQGETHSKHQELRQAIENGLVSIWHFPHELDADYLVVEKDGEPEYSLVGFCTSEEIKRQLVYSWGIYMTNKKASRDLKDLYTNLLLAKVMEHIREEEKKDPQDRCVCFQFYDKKKKALLPRA